MKSKKSYNKILVLFCIIVVSVLMTGCDGDLPIVLFFFASPSTINQGESSTLFWGVAKADTVTITSGVGTVASSGSITVSPGVTTEYTLFATNSTGSVSASVTVTLPPVHNLTKDTYYKNIQEALDNPGNGDIIEVSNGIYDETIWFPSDKKVILQSVNGPNVTIIRGFWHIATVNLDSSLPGTTIEGFTITYAVGLSGRGIHNDMGSNLTIDNCTVSDNLTAGEGGGIFNGGTLTITGASTISGNKAYYDGGGIENVGTLTITGASTISANTVYDDGGGIYNYGTLTITGASTVSYNTADCGGGIYNHSGTLTITGASTVSGNKAWDDGGGIYIYSPYTIITASTILDNFADSNGGGIYIYDSSSIPTIGGSSSAKKNTICGNYKYGNSPSLDQQIRDSSGDLYDAYKDTNYIGIYCPIII